MSDWLTLLTWASGAFTRRGFSLFQNLATAWILCPVRRTVTGMIRLLGPGDPHAHDAYHRLLRAARWRPSDLWGAIVHRIVNRYYPQGTIELIGDDTLARKTGRQVAGAGLFRDPVRSTARSPVLTLGLHAVVLAIRIRPPWGGEPLALPVNFRLHRKDGPSHLDLMEDMVRQLAGWLPHRSFHLICDGAYASLASRDLPRTHITSRLRRDAALFDLPPPRKPGQRGRPRKRGHRLPPLPTLARQANDWRLSTVDIRGRLVQRLLHTRPVLWYQVCGSRPILLVIARDPTGREPDDFFFTTDLTASGPQVVSRFASRWSIEDTFRNTKQFLGAEQPQCWKSSGPERALSLAFWLYTAVWHWYLSVHGDRPVWTSTPWYPAKTTPSFLDALTALRRCLWQERIFAGSKPRPLPAKMSEALIELLARAG